MLLVAAHMVMRRSLTLRRSQLVRLLLLGGVGYAFESTLFFAALERAPAAVVGLIFYSYPLWTTIVGLLTGLETFRISIIAALLSGTLGVALVFSVARADPVGALLALAAAFAVTGYFVAAQLFVRDVEPSVAATWTAVGAAATLSAASVMRQVSLPAAAMAPALGLGVVTAFAFAAMFGAISRIGSARTGIAMMLEPVTTVVLAALILEEQITLRVGVGAALVITALPLLLATRPEQPRPVATSTAP